MIVKILDRYIVRTFLHSLLMWFIVIMVLRIIVDLFRQMDEFAESDAGVFEIVGFICSYYFYNSFVYFTQMGGIMIVAAAAFSLARMNHTNELTAMLASGVSLHRVVWPIILCAMIMGGLLIVDQEFVIPNIKHKLARSADGQNRDERFQIRFLTDGDQSVWWSGDYSPAEKKMHYPLVIFRDSQFNYLGHFLARQATPGVFTDKGGREEQGWIASDGEIAKIARRGEDVWRQRQKTSKITTVVGPGKVIDAVIEQCRREKTAGKRESVPTADQVQGAKNLTVIDPEFNMTIRAEQFFRWPVIKRLRDPATGKIKKVYGMPRLERPKFEFRSKDDRVLATIIAESATWQPETPQESHWKLEEGRIFHASDLTSGELQLRQSGRWLDYMSSGELTSLLQLKRTNDPRAVRMTKYVRFADPLNNLIMLLLGLPFILSRQRNIKASAGLCVLIVGIFYVTIYICRYMGLPDFWAAFLPVLVFGPVSVLMLDSIKT